MELMVFVRGDCRVDLVLLTLSMVNCFVSFYQPDSRRMQM